MTFDLPAVLIMFESGPVSPVLPITSAYIFTDIFLGPVYF